MEVRLLIKSKGTVGWGAESSCHDKTFVRTGEFPYFGRTYQPSGYALKDVLKEAIKEFDGTVIVVSHDREFLDGLVTKVYEFGGGVVKEHIGGIYDFYRKENRESE